MGWLRKNGVTVFLALLIVLLLFVPNAKSWFLKGLLKTGIFNASVNTENAASYRPLPADLNFTRADGRSINSQDLSGKIVFINCWADWCPPCRAEMSSIDALYKQFKDDKRFVFVLANMDGGAKRGQLFMQSQGYQLPVYQPNYLPADWYTGVLPTTIIINKNGQVIQQHEGIANYNSSAMKDFLVSLAK